MDGILHVISRLGQSLALLEQKVVDLETENAQLRKALAESAQGQPHRPPQGATE